MVKVEIQPAQRDRRADISTQDELTRVAVKKGAKGKNHWYQHYDVCGYDYLGPEGFHMVVDRRHDGSAFGQSTEKNDGVVGPSQRGLLEG